MQLDHRRLSCCMMWATEWLAVEVMTPQRACRRQKMCQLSVDVWRSSTVASVRETVVAPWIVRCLVKRFEVYSPHTAFFSVSSCNHAQQMRGRQAIERLFSRSRSVNQTSASERYRDWTRFILLPSLAPVEQRTIGLYKTAKVTWRDVTLRDTCLSSCCATTDTSLAADDEWYTVAHSQARRIEDRKWSDTSETTVMIQTLAYDQQFVVAVKNIQGTRLWWKQHAWCLAVSAWHGRPSVCVYFESGLDSFPS